jgi:hypothetical protein
MWDLTGKENRWFWGLCALAFVGCYPGPSYTLTKTGTPGAAKPANCDFVLATTKVDRPYQEVGILDSEVWAEDAASFKTTVQKQVCEVGGDAVVTEVNSNGRYVRGTILRFTE